MVEAEMNTRMAGILSAPDVQQLIHQTELEASLDSLLGDGVIEQSGVWLLRAMLPEGFNADLAVSQSFDRTDVECSANHVHVGEFVDAGRSWSLLELLVQAYKYAQALAALLDGKGAFEVILGCQDPAAEWAGCTVRFHLIRPGEEWLAPDLEGYKEEAMLVLRTAAP